MAAAYGICPQAASRIGEGPVNVTNFTSKIETALYNPGLHDLMRICNSSDLLYQKGFQVSDSFSFDTFLSPFSWRYGSQAMRQLWSEVHKRRMWRRLWVALADAQAAVGLVTAEQVADLRAHVDEIDMRAALTAEAALHHDLMAEVQVFAAQCPLGGGIIHLGATSMDIEDNADALRLRDSLDLIVSGLRALLAEVATQIERWSDTPA